MTTREDAERAIADVLIGTRYPATMFHDEAVRLVEGIVAKQAVDALIESGLLNDQRYEQVTGWRWDRNGLHRVTRVCREPECVPVFRKAFE